jgi:hypothetical protein
MEFWGIVLAIVFVGYGIWRMNMALNHPEKYERLKENEREQQERRDNVARKGIAVLARLLNRQ